MGAHLGRKTFPQAQADPAIRVYAFEPILEIAAQRMGLLPNYIVVPMAVSDQRGCADFYLNGYKGASSLLELNKPGLDRWIGKESLQEVTKIRVPTIRLDEFMREAGITSIDFLKVDTQGTDLAVVRSAGEFLPSIKRVVLEVQISEVELYRGSSKRDEILAFMNESGFVLETAERQTYDQEENLSFARRDQP